MVAATLLLDELFLAAIAPLLPRFVHELGLSPPEAGLLVAADAIGTVLAASVAPVLTRRVGPKHVTLGGLVVVAVASLGFGVARTQLTLDVARLLQGAGGSLSWAAGLTWLVRAVPAHRRGHSIGLALGSAAAGTALGPALGAAGAYLGTALAFGTAAVACLLLMLIAILLPDASAQATPADGPSAHLDRSGALPILAAFVVLGGLIGAALVVRIPVELDRLGLSSGAIAAVFVLAAVAQAALSHLAGSWTDRFGPVLFLCSGFLLSGALLVLLPLVQASAVIAATTIGILAASGFASIPTVALLANVVEAKGMRHEVSFAWQEAGWALGYLIGGLGTGYLLATAAWLPFALLACGCTLASTLAWRHFAH